MSAGATATASFQVAGTVGRKAVCESLLELTGTWSATATTDGGPVKYGEAGPLTVTVGC
jgi:hypothetical protein